MGKHGRWQFGNVGGPLQAMGSIVMHLFTTFSVFNRILKTIHNGKILKIAFNYIVL